MGLRVRAVLVVLSLLAVAALAVPLGAEFGGPPNRGACRRTGPATRRARRCGCDARRPVAASGRPLLRGVRRRRADHRFRRPNPGRARTERLRPRRRDGGESCPGRRAGVAVDAHPAVGPTPASRRRGCPPRRRIGRRRRDGGRHQRRSARHRRSAGCGWHLAVSACSSLAVLVARALTRWVLRPLNGLERAVAEMTEGVAGPPADVAGPPELRHFTSAFNTMAQVVRASLDRQRRLVADASHQLRNPLAAVRLRADSLEDYVTEAGRSTYGSMTAELDRLENLLEQLLRLARAEQVSGSRRVGLSAAVAESTDLDGRGRRTHRVLAAGRRRAGPATAVPPGSSRACGAARPPRRGAAARRRTGQRAALRRSGHHRHRVDRAHR